MFRDYISFLEDKGKAQNTLISYTNDLHSFFNELKIKPYDYVTATDIRKWIHTMLFPKDLKPLATTTINRRLKSLRGFYSWATKYSSLEHNPMQEIQDLKTADEDYEKIMWLTEEEFGELLNTIRNKPVRSRGVNPEGKYRRD